MEVTLKMVANIVGYNGSLRGSRALFQRMSEAVAAAPMAFFDANPSGRMLNRFTSDVGKVDTQLQGEISMQKIK